jgi:AraC-like DNA-binding protein
LVGAAKERGIPERFCLARSELSPAHLQDQSLKIEAGQELAVIRNVVEALEEQASLAVIAGSSGVLRMAGFLSFAMISSPNAREAMGLCRKTGFREISPLFFRPEIKQEAHGIKILFEDEQIPDDVRPFLTARDLTLCLSLMPFIFGRKPEIAVSTSLADDQGADLLRMGQGLSVRATAGEDAIHLGDELLSDPLPNADSDIYERCKRNIQEAIWEEGERTEITARVRSALLRRGSDIPTLTSLAAEHHMDPRTLRRRLAIEGTSFRELATEARKTFAVEGLTRGATVQQMADRLGYHDAATFGRAFRRWTGRTPGSIAKGRPSDVSMM